MPGSLSQASQKGSQIQNNYNTNNKGNIAGTGAGGLNTSSALSGNDNFDGKKSLNGAAPGSNTETRTF